jgi:uncharacterized protein YrrD
MYRYSKIIGLPVVCIENGETIGNIEDLIVDAGRLLVVGFLLEKRGYERSRKVIPLRSTAKIGEDSLQIGSSSCVKDMKPQKETFLNERLKGLSVLSKNGENLGKVHDIIFDGKSAVIEGVEISGGLIEDVLKGRNILHIDTSVEFAGENMIVDRKAADTMRSTGGGIKRKFLQGE